VVLQRQGQCTVQDPRSWRRTARGCGS
jgi:hypothetical protein